MIKLALVGFCAGLIIIEQLPVPYSLDNFSLLIVLLIPLFFNPLFFSQRAILFRIFALFFVVGAVWALYQIEQQRSAVIPQQFMTTEQTLALEITELPFQSGDALRIVGRILCLESSKSDEAHKNLCHYAGKRLLLKWFNAPVSAESVTGRWMFNVTLKPPRGLVNPVGFDYEKWLFLQKISAVGSIRSGTPFTAQDPKDKTRARQSLSSVAHVQIIRAEIKSALNNFLTGPAIEGESSVEASHSNPGMSSQSKALLFALVLGDRSLMDANMWQALTATQTSHLVAISGLHMSLIVGIALLFLRLLLRLVAPGRWRFLFPRVALLALLPAAGYLFLAGFSLPTQRAFLMSAMVIFAYLVFRQTGLITSLLVSVAVILVLQPLAPLSVSFWLTCTAVFWIAWLTQGRLGSFSGVVGQLGLQTKIYVAMVPISLLFFAGSSVVGVIANWIAIPMLGFLIMPLLLVTMLVYALSPENSYLLWQGVGFLLDGFWWLIEWFAAKEMRLLMEWPQQNLFWLFLFGGLLLSPLTWRATIVPLPFLLLPIFVGEGEQVGEGEVKVVMFDVGQGTSLLVETANHQLLYDTGVVFPSGFNMIDAAVLPYLKKRFRPLDMLVVSHSDIDHSGGVDALLRQWPVGYLLADPWLDRKQENLDLQGQEPQRMECLDGLEWQWDRVNFSILKAQQLETPQFVPYRSKGWGGLFAASDNNQSCILVIEFAGRRIVLAGDIESDAERALLQRDLGLQGVDVLLVPHHGSRTSSSIGFLNRLNPDYALISCGYNNRFQHPHQKVVDRYFARGATVLNTAQVGAVEITLGETGLTNVETHRSAEKAYFWRQINLESDTDGDKGATTSNNERKISKFVLNFLKNNVQGFIMSGL